MEVSIRPKGHEDYFTIEVTIMEGEDAKRLAQRVVDQYNSGGDGKIKVDGWTYRYVFGTIQPPKHC
jgi:hypothetical protein